MDAGLRCRNWGLIRRHSVKDSNTAMSQTSGESSEMDCGRHLSTYTALHIVASGVVVLGHCQVWLEKPKSGSCTQEHFGGESVIVSRELKLEAPKASGEIALSYHTMNESQGDQGRKGCTPSLILGPYVVGQISALFQANVTLLRCGHNPVLVVNADGSARRCPCICAFFLVFP